MVQDTMLASVPHANAGTKRRPNLLLLLADSWRADFDGLHNSTDGNAPPQLPVITRLASSGVRFTQAFTAAPLCTPSRITLLTGRDFDRAGRPSQGETVEVPRGLPTLYQSLGVRGYYTMRSGILPVGGHPERLEAEFGLNASSHTAHKEFIPRWGADDSERWRERRDDFTAFLESRAARVCNRSGYAAYTDYFHSRASIWSEAGHSADPVVVDIDRLDRQQQGPCALPDALQHDDFIMARAIDLLERAPAQSPWMLDVSLVGPHPPFLRLRRGDGSLCAYDRGARAFERCRYSADVGMPQPTLTTV